MSADFALRFDDLVLGYGSHPAVHHLSGVVRRGSLTAVVGANGSGKSTLMKGVAGALRPLSGRLERAPGQIRAYLPQLSEVDRTFPASVADLVGLGHWPRRGLLGRWRDDDRERQSRALRAVGLDGFERRAIDTLSGGQLQRALFARVVLQDADLILLDEPFNAVDGKTVGDLVALIRQWWLEKRTVLVVVHDLDLVRAEFPEALLLARRPVAWGVSREVLTPDNLTLARRFQEAWDDEAPWCDAAVGSKGHVHDADPEHVHGNVAGHSTHPHGRGDATLAPTTEGEAA